MRDVGGWEAYHVHSGTYHDDDTTKWDSFVLFVLKHCDGRQADWWPQGVFVVDADESSRIAFHLEWNNPNWGHMTVKIMTQGTAYVHMLDLMKTEISRYLQVQQTLTKCPGKGCPVLVDAVDPLKSVSRCGTCGHRYDGTVGGGGGGDNNGIDADETIQLSPSWLAEEEEEGLRAMVSCCFGKFANGDNLLFVFADDDKERYYYKELQAFVLAGVIALNKGEVLRPSQCELSNIQKCAKERGGVWNDDGRRRLIVWLSLRKGLPTNASSSTEEEEESNLISCQDRHMRMEFCGRFARFIEGASLFVLTAADGREFAKMIHPSVPCMYFKSDVVVVTEEMRTMLAKTLIDTHLSSLPKMYICVPWAQRHPGSSGICLGDHSTFYVQAYARLLPGGSRSLVCSASREEICYDDMRPLVMDVLKPLWYAFLARTTNNHKITRSKCDTNTTTLLNEDVLSVILSHLV